MFTLSPPGFAYLHDIDDTIKQDMRYAGNHNFIGRPIAGYTVKECILTQPAALALIAVQQELRQQGYSLKVYDCYRPTRAVADFMQWSQDPASSDMKNEFYPRVNKGDVFKLGYVAEKSGHSRGSTVDLTIVPVPAPIEPKYHVGQKLIACFAPTQQRFHDNSIDMGTGFDCMDELSYPGNKLVNATAQQNRMLLREIMIKHGFEPYDKEWWHFTLDAEPYPHTYFNFEVA